MTDRSVRKSIEKILRAYGRELFDSHVAYVDGFCAEQGAVSSERIKIPGSPVRRRSRRVLIAAAIIVMLLAMAATAIGIVRPQIFYDIKERLTHWDIQFTQSSDEAVSPGFEYVSPTVPEGYRITNEVKGNNNYFIEFRNDNDESVRYEQMRPDGATVNIFNEDGDSTRQIINGHEAIITRWDDSSMIVIENGEYVFELEGNCGFSELYEMAENLTIP